MSDSTIDKFAAGADRRIPMRDVAVREVEPMPHRLAKMAGQGAMPGEMVAQIRTSQLQMPAPDWIDVRIRVPVEAIAMWHPGKRVAPIVP